MKNKKLLWILVVISELLMVSIVGYIILRPSNDFYTDPSSFFISEWDTTKTSVYSTDFNQIRLPLEPNGIYNFIVYWDDNTKDNIITWDQSEVLHTYHKAGTYNITISGTISGWSFNNTGDQLKLLEIKQWGNLHLGNSGGYFYGCQNLNITATDILNLTGTTSLSHMFHDCQRITEVNNMESWDVSSVTDMSWMFNDAKYFNQNLSSWNVSNVIDMHDMFSEVTLSTSNYDSMLIGWSKLILQDGVYFDAGYSKYSPGTATTARNYIIDTYHWQISDGGQI